MIFTWMGTGKGDQTAFSHRMRRGLQETDPSPGLHGEATGANGGLVRMQFVPFSSSPSSLRLSLLHGVSSALWDSEPPRKQPLDEGAGVPVKLAQAGIATSRQLAPRASAKHGPSPELPSPTPSAAPPPHQPAPAGGAWAQHPAPRTGPAPPGERDDGEALHRDSTQGPGPGRAGGLRAALAARAGRGH